MFTESFHSGSISARALVAASDTSYYTYTGLKAEKKVLKTQPAEEEALKVAEEEAARAKRIAERAKREEERAAAAARAAEEAETMVGGLKDFVID